MVAGLRLPFLSEHDPEVGAEGGIDPLGLASIADRLADSIAPGITARMSRIRFVSAICAAAVVLERFAERASPDGSPPYLVFEWMVVEAFARRGKELPSDARQIPGIDKARAALARDERMSARNYLKTPKVFGFHGVYRTLAEALELIDRDGMLREQGDRLARAWEKDLGIEGFVDRAAAAPGSSLRAQLEQQVDAALRSGQVAVSPGANLFTELLRAFRPDAVGTRERRVLRELLFDPGEPVRREVLEGLAALGPGAPENDLVDILRRKASRDLEVRLEAIRRFETMAQLLTRALRRITFLSSQLGTRPLAPDRARSDRELVEIATMLPGATRRAGAALDAAGMLLPLELFRARFTRFEESLTPSSFFETLIAHHEQIQRQKKPRGKRSWFDRAGDGVVVRTPYRTWEPPEASERFVHPYRLRAMLQFLGDLQ